MAKKKEKEKKKKKKTLSKRLRKLSLERVMLIVVSAILIIVVAIVAISSLTKDDEGPSVAAPPEGMPGEDEQASGDQPGTGEGPGQPPAGAEATPTPKRLEVLPSPTGQVLPEDDPRTTLNLTRPYASDNFEGKTWSQYDGEKASYSLEQGQLVGIDHEPEERYIYWSLWTEFAPADPYGVVTVTNGDCIEKDSVGFVIRVQADRTPSGYALELSCDGHYRFRNHQGNNPADELVDWTPSDAINPGAYATNQIGLWGYKGKFHFFINGQHVGEYYDYDASDTYGYFGVYVRASYTFDLTATFDDFAFWQIPPQEP